MKSIATHKKEECSHTDFDGEKLWVKEPGVRIGFGGGFGIGSDVVSVGVRIGFGGGFGIGSDVVSVVYRRFAWVWRLGTTDFAADFSRCWRRVADLNGRRSEGGRGSKIGAYPANSPTGRAPWILFGKGAYA